MLNIVAIGAFALAVAQQTDTTFAVKPNGTVAVENFSGEVRVKSWDRDQIRVVGRHSSRTMVDIEASGNRVEIGVHGRMGPGQADLELTVPKTYGVSIEGVNVTVAVEGVVGDVDVETANGTIDVRGGRRVQAESMQGVVTIEGANGRVSASSVNGGVRLRNVTGEVALEAVSGAISMIGIDARHVNAETVNGAIEFEGKLYQDGTYSLASHNGRILLAVPEKTNANFSVYTFNGKLGATFPVELGTARSRGRYNFTLGSGGAQIELESFGGTIQLVRPGERPPESERKKVEVRVRDRDQEW